MIEYITFILGIIIGIYYGHKTLFQRKAKELTTDDCIKWLSDKGYWVRIGPKDKEE